MRSSVTVPNRRPVAAEAARNPSCGRVRVSVAAGGERRHGPRNCAPWSEVGHSDPYASHVKPQPQTIFVDPANPKQIGNCLQAVIASVLELPLDEVPHFAQVDEDTEGAVNWWAYLLAWLRDRGWRLDGTIMPDPGEVYLASGPSPRGVKHIVAYQHGRLLHDPHPSEAGLLEVQGRLVLRPCEPIPLSDKYRRAAGAIESTAGRATTVRTGAGA